MSVRHLVITKNKIYTVDGDIKVYWDIPQMVIIYHEHNTQRISDIVVPIHELTSVITVTVPTTAATDDSEPVIRAFDPSKVSVEELMDSNHDASSPEYLSELSQWADSAREHCDAIKNTMTTVGDKVKASSLSGDGEITGIIDDIDGRVDAITGDVAIIEKTGKLRKDMVLTSAMGVIDHEINSLTALLKDIDGLVGDISSSGDADIAGKSVSVIERLKSILDLDA